MNSHSETHAFLCGLYDSYSQGDMGPTMAIMADDILFEYVGPADIFPFCGVRSGKAQMLEAVALIGAEFDIVSLAVERVLVDDDGYVVVLSARFKSKITGVTMACQLVDVAKTRGGQIVELREYWDVESVTSQLMGKKLALAAS